MLRGNSLAMNKAHEIPREIEKYRTLYQFCKDCYDQSWDRLSWLDKKAQMFLAVFALQITAIGFGINTLRTLILKWNCLSTYLLILAIASLAVMFAGISFLVHGMKIRKMRSLPDPALMLKNFKDNDEMELLTSLSTRISEDRNKNEGTCEKKATAIERSTYCVWVSFVLIITLFITLICSSGS